MKSILRRRRLVFLFLPCIASLYLLVAYRSVLSPGTDGNESQDLSQSVGRGHSLASRHKLPVENEEDDQEEVDLKPLKDQTLQVTSIPHDRMHMKRHGGDGNQRGTIQGSRFTQSLGLRGLNFSSSMNDSRIISQAFARKIVGADKTILMDIVRAFDKLISGQLNLTYFMYGGSLLGSFRHHDLIPWDDDLDLFVNFSDKRLIFSELEKLYPKYEVFEAGPRLKFYSQYSSRRGRYPWNWPYVDIHFFHENSTHIWDSSEEFHQYSYRKSIVFPLHRRPLGGLRLNAPRDSFANLKATYVGVDCISLAYSHELEIVEPLRGVTIPCSILKEVYPFVHRSKFELGDGVNETLKVGDTVLYSIYVNEPSYAITKPFSLELIGAT